MAQRLEDHLRLRLLVNGAFMLKASSVSIEFDAGAQRVDTLEGLAGKTPGSGTVTITGNFAVPIGGPEHDFYTDCVKGSYIELQVPFGGKSYIGNGWCQTAGLSQSTGANTEGTFSWTGEFAELR